MSNLEKIVAMLMVFFKDESKASVWLTTENVLLGDQVPMEMIKIGRSEKLLQFVINAADNHREDEV